MTTLLEPARVDVASAMAAVLQPDLLAQVAALSLAITADQPGGRAMRHDPAYDAIREARRQDDPDLPTGVWQSTLKTADWGAVERLASNVLISDSKDLMITAWLGEAWLHRYGLEGLAAALLLAGNLCQDWWPHLHPQAVDGDQSWRASPLEWLVRTYSETLHAGMPLPGVPTHEMASRATLDQYLNWQRQRTPATDSKVAKANAEKANLALKSIQDAVRTTSWTALDQQLKYVFACKQLLARLDACCTHEIGPDAPSVSGLQRVLVQLEQVLNEFCSWVPAPIAPPPLALPIEEEVMAEMPTEVAVITPRAAQVASGREDAYRQLQAIADYLARTEPHSPVPYLIYRAVEWGNKPLPALLGELLAGDAEARRMWSLLGVLP